MKVLVSDDADIPSLAQLREWEFGGPVKPHDPPLDGHQIGPKRFHKVYRSSQKELWLYRPTRRWHGKELLPPAEQFRAVAEIAPLLDERPLEQLIEEVEGILKQLLHRAHRGDKRAIRLFTATVRRSVSSLSTLAAQQPEKVRAEAEEEPRWPVLLSRNPQDQAIAESLIHDLHVGEKATTPTRPGQKVDRRNLWTKLASLAVNECEITAKFVPVFEAHAANAGASPQRIKVKVWATSLSATGYDLEEEGIVIADWQKKCVSLSKPITKQNFKDWWQAVKGFVLEYWQTSPEAYASALKYIGDGSLKKGRRYKEDRKRNLALYAVHDALESLLGVR